MRGWSYMARICLVDLAGVCDHRGLARHRHRNARRVLLGHFGYFMRLMSVLWRSHLRALNVRDFAQRARASAVQWYLLKSTRLLDECSAAQASRARLPRETRLRHLPLGDHLGCGPRDVP
jgi:hypothetical protein